MTRVVSSVHADDNVFLGDEGALIVRVGGVADIRRWTGVVLLSSPSVIIITWFYMLLPLLSTVGQW